MIPCTEFIPAYSELFTFLENKKGREEVDHYWHWLFDPSSDSIPLDKCLQKEGLRGCWSYWAVSLNEEASANIDHPTEVPVSCTQKRKAGFFFS